MEMGASQLALRLIGSVGRLDQHKLRTGRLASEDWERLSAALGRLNEAPILIDETPALNAIEVRSRARRLMKTYGKLGLVIVDYLQLMQASTTGENRATEISEISRSMKALAKELRVPVMALSQLNRSLEQRPNKRPVMSDLRESGAIEQDADLILFIYRDEVYNPDTQDKGVAEIIIGKQRNGPDRHGAPHIPRRVHPLRELRRRRGRIESARFPESDPSRALGASTCNAPPRRRATLRVHAAAACLDCVLKQNHQYWELRIADDASITAASLEVLAR